MESSMIDDMQKYIESNYRSSCKKLKPVKPKTYTENTEERKDESK